VALYKLSNKKVVNLRNPPIKLSQIDFLKCLLLKYECTNCTHYAKSVGWCAVDDEYNYEYPICEFFQHE
jgi:hypothetical protein